MGMTLKQVKRGRGRPPIEGETMQQSGLRLPAELFERAGKIVAKRNGATSRAAVLREAVIIGLEALEKFYAKRTA